MLRALAEKTALQGKGVTAENETYQYHQADREPERENAEDAALLLSLTGR